MHTLLNRLISVVRACLGWNEPSADQPDGRLMTPAHGWLLPLTIVADRSPVKVTIGQRPRS